MLVPQGNAVLIAPTRWLAAIVIPLAAAGLLPRRADAQIVATATVDVTQPLATVSPLALGMHTSPYYNELANASLDERIEEAGVTTLRYGGGGYADVFHWSVTRSGNGIQGNGLSPWWGEPNNFGYVGPGSDFATFVRLLDRTDNAQAVVTVNYGSAMKIVDGQSRVPDFGGQPQEAAAWVAYANADPAIYGTANDVVLGVDQQGNDWKTAGYWARLRASTSAEYQSWASADGVYDGLNSFLAIDRAEPVGITHWEIGNETFGTGYYDDSGNGYSVDYDVPYNGTARENHPNLSPAHYGQEVVQYAQLMRAVDPTIKIGAVLATPPDDYGWSYADLNNNNFRNSNEPFWNDEVLANAASEIDFVMVHWYPYIGENANGATLLSEVPAKLGRMINGSTPFQDSGTSAGVRDSLAAHGIADAEIMVTEFNYFGSLAPSVANAAESLFVADAYATWLKLGVTSVQYLELLGKDFLNDGNSLNRGSAYYGVSLVDRLIEPGEWFVESSATHNDIGVHAALQADGSVAVMLLNRDLSDDASVTLSLNGADVASQATVYTVTGGLNLEEGVFDASGGLTVNVPARSMAVYVFPPNPATLGDFNGDGAVDAADYTVWRDGLGATHAAGQYNAWAGAYGSTTQTFSTSTQAPEPSSLVLTAILKATLVANARRASCLRSRPACSRSPRSP